MITENNSTCWLVYLAKIAFKTEDEISPIYFWGQWLGQVTFTDQNIFETVRNNWMCSWMPFIPALRPGCFPGTTSQMKWAWRQSFTVANYLASKGIWAFSGMVSTKVGRIEEMAQKLGVCIALPEDASSVPGVHVDQLTTTSHSNSRGYDSFYWPPGALQSYSHALFPHPPTHTK